MDDYGLNGRGDGNGAGHCDLHHASRFGDGHASHGARFSIDAPSPLDTHFG